MAIIEDPLTGAIGKTFNFVDRILGRFFPDPLDRDKARLLLLELQQNGELAKIAAQSNMIMAEANSKDKWTSRARPSFMYVFYAILIMLMVGSIVSIWYPAEVQTASDTFQKLFAGIPEPMWWTFTAGYLGYTGARTYEKRTGVAGNGRGYD